MPIVPPPKKTQAASGGLNGKQGGGPAVPAGGKVENPKQVTKHSGSYLNGGSVPSMPKYGTAAGGPYQPQAQPQGKRSSQKPLS